MSGIRALAQDTGDDEQVKIEADKLFQQKKYAEAFPLYSQLLSLHRKDPFFSYRFGVCMLYSDRRDPEEPIRYIAPSAGQLSGEDAVMIHFHLGVAYHQAYRFGEAIRSFETCKTLLSVKSPYYKELLTRIDMCNNGITLLQNLSDLVVMKKYDVRFENFFRSYDLSKFGGNIGPKPDFLKTKPDRNSNDPELIFFSDSHQVVYYSSYGKKNVTGRDIYRVYKLPGGKWSEPEKLSNTVNTSMDENYPYLLPDGKTLYFSSKGHNSMGGYDIFRTVYDSSAGDWSTPVNVDFAINTPFDDFLFITDPRQKYAWFSSQRNSPDGRIMVYLVRIDEKIIAYDDFHPEMIGAQNIDYNSDEYLKSVETLRRKSNLDVNSQEEIVIDTAKTIATNNNARYHIPDNPTAQEVVDIAFAHVDSAENHMDDFRYKRDQFALLADRKKDEATRLEKQSQDMYDQATAENDSRKRKEFQAQAKDLAVRSLKAREEADYAKAMYDQYVKAADDQAGALDKMKERAGFVQKLALSRQIDTSVVLLKKLIDDIDTFKIYLVQQDNIILGNQDYLTQLEKEMAGDKTLANELEKQADALDKEMALYNKEAESATDPEIKQDYLSEATRLKAESDSLRAEARNRIEKANQKQNNLVAMKEKSELRSSLINDAMVLNVDTNLVADHYQPQTNDTAGTVQPGDHHHAGDQDTTQTNHQLASHDTDTTNQIHADTVINHHLDTANHTDTNNVAVNNQHQDANTVDAVQKELMAGMDSIRKSRHSNDLRKDAASLTFANRKSDYDFKLREWEKLNSRQNLSPEEQTKKTELESDLYDLNMQMNVLSQFFKQSDTESARLSGLENEYESLIQSLSSLQPGDTGAFSVARDKGKELLNLASEQSNSQPVFTLQLNDLRSVVKETENRRDEFKQEVVNLEKQLRDQRNKLEKTKKPEKRKQLEDEIAQTEAELAANNTRLDELNQQIKGLNDSLDQLTRQSTMLGELKSSYLLLPESELQSMSSSWNALSNKPDIAQVASLPDFTSEPDHVKDTGQFVNIVAADTSNQNNNAPDWVSNNDSQSLVQADYYEKGAESFMIRIATLRKKLASNPYDSAQVKTEIDMLTRTMDSYLAEAEAYRTEAKNNFTAKGLSIPDVRTAPDQKSMIEFHEQQYIQDMIVADSLRKIAEKTPDQQTKEQLLQKAAESEESAKYHYRMASDIYGIWNNSTYESNNAVLASVNADKGNDLDKARGLMIEARQLRSQAARTTDFALQQDLYNRANEKESESIALQNKTMSSVNLRDAGQARVNIVSSIEKSTGMNIGDLTEKYSSNADVLAPYAKTSSDTTQMADVAVHTPDNNQNANNVSNNGDQINNNNNNTNNNNNANTAAGNHVATAGDTLHSNNPGDNGNNQVQPRVNLYYRVQIAASRVEVDTTKYFKGLKVVVDETGAWKQYMTGYFTSFNEAGRERDRVRPMGYPDAFVVAYYDGKRVPVYEARRYENGTVAAGNANTATNIRPAGGADNFAIAQVEGLVYSVQVGVYAKTRNSNSLFGISPLIEERMNNGYYRYYAGTFTNMNEAVAARNSIRGKGVPDAFVVILFNGKKITQAEATQLQAGGTTFGGSLKQPGAGNQPQNTQAAATNTTPSAKPVYKVQIGAYSKDVPVNVVNELIALTGQGVETTKNDAGLTVYTVGNYAVYTDAEAKKNELNAKGIADAFVVAYVDGKRVSVSEARKIAE